MQEIFVLREFKLIKQAIEKFNLDLTDLTVLTEGASGNFFWTPFICSFSNAKEVLVYVKDNTYSTKEEVIQKYNYFLNHFNIQNIKLLTELTKEVISKANIITNTAMLRPLNEEKLKFNHNCVIPLMYEAWEFRESDLDLQYCIDNNILVAGTNEYDNRVRTIDYLGLVVKKLMFEFNLEVQFTNVLLIGEGKFAKSIYNSLVSDKANIDNLIDADNYKKYDCIVFADHESDNLYIGVKGLLDLEDFNDDIKIIHISGNIDKHFLDERNIEYNPKNIKLNRFMSVTTDYVGPKPVIDLHSAGLKVGQLLYKAKVNKISFDKLKTYFNDNLIDLMEGSI